MKILQINSVCGFGSTGRIATDLYDKIKEKGWDCKIAYGRGEALNIPKLDAIRIGTDLDVKLHALLTRLTDKTGFYSKNATQKFLQWVDSYNPDIIHLHNIHGYYVHIGLLFDYIKTHNKRVVWTLHDCWSFTGHCAHFDYIGCKEWETACTTCTQRQSYPKSFVSNCTNNYLRKKSLFTGINNLTIICPSDWLSALAKKSYLQKYPIKTIHNGIDLEKFYPTPVEKTNDKKIVLGVASIWDDLKGLNDFIKLSSILDSNYQIILVGISQKQQKKLPKNIKGVTRTNNIEELAKLYSMASVFANPTYEDTFPTTNLEALACGTPVITYNTGGSIESVDATCGLVVEKGNIEELCKTIKEVCTNKTFTKKQCIARSKVFNKNTTYTQYCIIYEELAT